MKDKKKLIAVVFTKDYETIVLFEYDFRTNTVYETIIEYNTTERGQKLDWEDSLENLQKIINKFEKYGWGVCRWT